ncbi:hypothetical protein F2Q69_00005687 [Brassica cretica]|uniref:Uncharacterized protein n=1 Tax=Brassica cretica TaxID=69181 RepID=A0A8S9P339_BRACR|nr:hypothetical protein F2Q69_00005687 [Brassica cretica]
MERKKRKEPRVQRDRSETREHDQMADLSLYWGRESIWLVGDVSLFSKQMTNWTRADVVRDRQGHVGRDGYGLYRKTDWPNLDGFALTEPRLVLGGCVLLLTEYGAVEPTGFEPEFAVSGIFPEGPLDYHRWFFFASPDLLNISRNACDSGSARLSPETRFVVKGDMTAAVEKRRDYGAADVGEVSF